MPSHPIATWITPCNSRNVQVLGTCTRRHTIGLIPSSQTLTCTISAASASAADEAVSKTGLVRFGARVTRPAYRRSPFPRRGHPRHPDALQERLRGRHIAVFTEQHVDQVPVSVDGAIEITPAPVHFQVCLTHIPAAAHLAAPTPPQIL